MLFWLLGDLSPAGDPTAALVVLAACAALAFSQSAALDVLVLGEDKARSLGVAVTRLQGVRLRLRDSGDRRAVLLGGMIGFVAWWCLTCCASRGCTGTPCSFPSPPAWGGACSRSPIPSAERGSARRAPGRSVHRDDRVPVLLLLLARLR